MDQFLVKWELQVENLPDAPVNTVMWSPDGKRIASGSVDTTVQVWDAASGKTLLTFRRHKNQVTSLAWSPDDTRFASAIGLSDVQIALVP